MFTNSILSSKTFIVMLLAIALDALIRMPLIGLTPTDVGELHQMIMLGFGGFAAKEAVTVYATDGKSSGTYKTDGPKEPGK